METESAGLDPLFSMFDQLIRSTIEFLPTLGFAVALLASGFAAAWVLRVIVLRIGAAAGILFSGTAGGRRTGTVRLPWPLSVVVANAMFWLTVVFFVSESSRVLGLEFIADLIATVASYLPTALVAAIILLAGYSFASIARNSIATSGEESQALGSLLFFTVNTIAVLAALRQIGIDLILVQSLLLIITAAAFGGLAYAFGKGAAPSLGNIIAAHYLRQVYRQGQRMRVGAIEGEILEITPTAVVIDTRNGRALIPASTFSREVSVLLGGEEASERE
ncbi:MAG: hypothetical protein O3C28_08435 [Proteobacteria bacterium]|nr:hypothetical protein [Pseudomonadota bacterium]